MFFRRELLVTHFEYNGNIVKVDDLDCVTFQPRSDEDDLIRIAPEITSVSCAKVDTLLTRSDLKKAQVYRGPLSIFSDPNAPRGCSDLMQETEVISGAILSARCKHRVGFSKSGELCVEVTEASLMSPHKNLEELICSPIKKQEAEDSALASVASSVIGR